jgi:predicted porin
MNKKLLTAAIAAVIAAPTAALANDVTVYGAVHVSVDYLNEFDSSWRGEVLVSDPSYRGTGFAPSVWAPAIRNNASVPGSVVLQPSEAVIVNGSTWAAAPSVGALANYYNFLDSLPGDRNDGFDVASRATRLGFKGTEDLANGLKAIWKMEFQIDVADRGGSCGVSRDVINSIGSPTLNQGDINGNCDSGQLVTARNAYVGLAGGWGTFLVGRHDTPFKMSTGKLDLFADTLADYNSTIGFVDIRTNSAIAYVSPSWSGLSFAGALVAPHVYSSNNSVYIDGSGNSYVARKSADSDGLAEAYSLALTYDNAGFFASVAYENISGSWFDAWTGGGATNLLFPGLAGAFNAPGLIYNSEDSQKWRVGLGWTGAGFTVGGLYEWEDNVLGIDGADGERWQISAGYTFGNNMIKAMYGQGDFNLGANLASATNFANGSVISQTAAYREDADQDAWAIGFDHNLSKRTKAYILYTAISGDSASSLGTTAVARNSQGAQAAAAQSGWSQKLDADRGGFSIGMIHTF